MAKTYTKMERTKYGLMILIIVSFLWFAAMGLSTILTMVFNNTQYTTNCTPVNVTVLVDSIIWNVNVSNAPVLDTIKELFENNQEINTRIAEIQLDVQQPCYSYAVGRSISERTLHWKPIIPTWFLNGSIVMMSISLFVGLLSVCVLALINNRELIKTHFIKLEEEK